MTLPRLVTLAAALLFLPMGLCGQSVTRDPNTGDYHIDYRISNESFQVMVPSADRISPALELTSLRFEGGVGVYEYRLTNQDRSPALSGRGILTLMIPCRGASGTSGTGGPQPIGWKLWVSRGEGGLASCVFEASLSGILDPGQSVSGLRVRSTALPELANAYAVGVSGGGVVSTGEDTPDTVFRLMEYASTRGADFGSIVPSRAREGISDPGNGVIAVCGDLGFACSVLGWVDDQGVCRSLRAKLQAASAALGRDQPSTAKNQLSAFRAELEAQRGKHVNDNAYFLLSVITDHTLGLLQQPRPALRVPPPGLEARGVFR